MFSSLCLSIYSFISGAFTHIRLPFRFFLSVFKYKTFPHKTGARGGLWLFTRFNNSSSCYLLKWLRLYGSSFAYPTFLIRYKDNGFNFFLSYVPIALKNMVTLTLRFVSISCNFRIKSTNSSIYQGYSQLSTSTAQLNFVPLRLILSGNLVSRIPSDNLVRVSPAFAQDRE